MFKGIITGIVLTIVVGLVGAYILVQSGYIPANADAEPSRLELWMADTSLDATMERLAPKGPNPVPLTDENLLAGVHLYGENCALCHGSSKGDETASPIAKGEYPKPPQFGTDGVEDDPEGDSVWKITHGVRLTGMPTWKEYLTEQQIWTLALFLKHMDKLPPAAQQVWQDMKPWPLQTGSNG